MLNGRQHRTSGKWEGGGLEISDVRKLLKKLKYQSSLYDPAKRVGGLHFFVSWFWSKQQY